MPLLGEAGLSEAARRRVGQAMWLPAVRFYARRQLEAWHAPDRSQAYLALLERSG